MQRPQNRETKDCPICKKSKATFWNRVERSHTRAVFGSMIVENMTSAWRCNDAECDYFVGLIRFGGQVR